MGIVAFLKPIIDMFYQIQVLDVFLMIICILLFVTKRFKTQLCFMDFHVIILGILFLFAYLRNTDGLSPFLKIESCFLLYFLGRKYDLQLETCSKYIKWGFLIVLFFTSFTYITGIGFVEWGRYLTFRGLYFFKTDLATAMMQCIALFAFTPKRSKLNYAVIILCSFFIIIADARMYYIVWFILLSLFMLFLYEEKTQKEVKIGIFHLIPFILGLFGALYFLNYLNNIYGEQYLLFEFEELTDLSDERNTQGRSLVWAEIYMKFAKQDFWTRFWGIDLITDVSVLLGYNSHNLYLKLLYSIGYFGIATYLIFFIQTCITVRRTSNKYLKYVTISFLVIFYLGGISYITIESTQLSWIPMFLTGACVTNTLKSPPKNKNLKKTMK